MYKKLTLAVACLLLSTEMFASHIVGAELTYFYNGTNYTINLDLYSICGGALVGTSPQYINCHSTSCSANLVDTLTYTGTDSSTGMICSGGCTAPGPDYILVNHFSGNISLSACNDWKFTYENCCLNAQILNMSNSSGGYIHLESFLDNSVALNNSAKIKNLPPFYIYANTINTASVQSVDPDGDSVVYQFVQPQDYNGVNMTYSTGYSFSAPFGSGSYTNFDQANQYIQLKGSNAGLYWLSMRTNEYRNGNLSGYCTRTWMAANFPSGVPKAPLPAPGSTYNYLTHPGQTQTITFNFNDSTSTDSVFVAFEPTNSWTYTTTSSPAAGSGAGTITWTTPTSLNPATTPYFYIYVLGKSNACTIRGYTWCALLINTAYASPNDSVWAGDANDDYVANMYDPLAIAVAYGQTGPTRTGASTAWTPQYCANWSTYFLPSSINVKHADCNGDGTVNSTDLASVTANYGMSHPKLHANAHKTTSAPDLYFDLTSVVLTPGANISIPIKFGTTSLPMNNIYGLAASVEIISPINLTAAPTITYSTSWIGTTSNTLNFTKNINNNHVDWAYARTDQTNVSGNSTIATLNFTVPTTATAGQQMKFHFDMPQVIDKNGNIITAYNALDDSMDITVLGIVNVASPVQYAEVVPNPSHSHTELQMYVEKANNMQVKIIDILGKTVWQQTMSANTGNQSISLPSANLAPGIYMIRVQGEGWQYGKTLKWIKE